MHITLAMPPINTVVAKHDLWLMVMSTASTELQKFHFCNVTVVNVVSLRAAAGA